MGVLEPLRTGATDGTLTASPGNQILPVLSRARPPAKYPRFETLIAERNHLFAKHPKTIFIAAHLAFHGNDLDRLGKLFDAYHVMSLANETMNDYSHYIATAEALWETGAVKKQSVEFYTLISTNCHSITHELRNEIPNKQAK